MPKRLLTCLTLSIAAALGSGAASALGFARTQPAATLGATLDFVVGVRLDPSEVLLPNCVSAEVYAAETRLPRHQVSTVVESPGGSPAIRVKTAVSIDEPVVTVVLTAGCEARITRRFTLFLDPPGVSMGVPAVVAAEPLVSPVPADAPVIGQSVSQPLPASPPLARAAGPGRAERAHGRPRRSTVARGTRKLTVATTTAPAARRKAPGQPEVASASARDAAHDGARLRLDAPSVTYAADRLAAELAEQREAALNAVRQSASAAHGAAMAASARVAAMESSLDALKRESQANREAVARLQKALADAGQREQWNPWLLAVVVALLAVAGWLYARLRRSDAEKQQAWWNSSQAAALSAHPQGGTAASGEEPGSATAQPARHPARHESVDALPRGASGSPVSTEAELEALTSTGQSTQPMPAGIVVPDGPQRDVSIEELLDTEQQAEFFIVLGQDDAAIDLLMGHLRGTGGTSPLPYLKLLEIFHRRGDTDAYERMRRRFNERFNAVAPDWANGPQAGRGLEGYPQVMAQIERSWARPIDAMADLETLLFRSDGRELFDLPAYADVLFLFTLARDLQEMAQHDTPHVDVLLPIAQGAAAAHPAGPVAPRPDRTPRDAEPTRPASLAEPAGEPGFFRAGDARRE